MDSNPFSNPSILSALQDTLKLHSNRVGTAILNETWKVGKSLAHRYVWATVITYAHRLEIYHRRSKRAAPRLIKSFDYQLPEVRVPLRPEYRRHTRRCPIWALL